MFKKIRNKVNSMVATAKATIATKKAEGYVDLDDLLGKNAPDNKKEKMICTCFQVTENVIWDAIKQNGLKTVEEVTNYTKAGGACGKCKSVIQDIIDTYYKKEKEETQKLTPTQWILKVNNVIETQISPELQKDGGDIELVDIKNKTIYVKLKGRCSGCKNSTMTLKSFAEKVLQDSLGSDVVLVEVK